MKHLALIILALLLLIPSGAQALTFLSGDQPVVDTPIPDDVVVTGGTVTVSAPVDSLTVAGGMVTVDAPVAGDVVAASGTLIVNGDVGGKVLAAGGEVELNGNATNALVTGGAVRIGENAVIERDAVISAGEVVNEGSVLGNLMVSGATFRNNGTAGNVTFEEQQGPGPVLPGLFAVLTAIGALILGLLIIKFLPGPFAAVVREVEKSPVVLTVLGFLAILVTVILLLIIAVTVVGLPIALVGGLLFIVALLISSLFVAYALGDVIASRTGWRPGPMGIFILGFVILQILMFIPLLGALVQVVAVSLGYGGILYALRGVSQSGAGEGAA